ncbi:DUF1120 domain-containing protein [Pseudomonas sichuanensis]|uniref:DUF1120 domain-containing protein n=1 Tax=Pseudomonas sichuanensis TaxID=2213015 RepID=UPI00244A42AB|nr:DUF1120 domain-containing protein [Pseudomonas sichuanensis]MDH0729569.1 DUF1120 domain-containing protein [Pseudomonas sichuanensis]MDH1582274.1 DUF1120 domain-containing protein [Pseudomonas sichuanensis]MDH1594590.1 DUF1120 domain-containing protein [Pseudomonas sichuanensis]MDH1596981.1 DUF1120 domain-containing protein [Pseudomonas sichuanensis]
MKIAAATLLAVIAAPCAQAQSTVELNVRGSVTPASCTPALTGGGVVDFGRISVQDLSQTQRTQLKPRPIGLSISCDAPTRFALRMKDNRDGTALVNSGIYYGLGLDRSGNRIGLYEVQFDPRRIQADALTQVYITDSTSAGQGWHAADLQVDRIGANDMLLGFSDTLGSVAGPVPIRDLTATLMVQVVVAPTDSLDTSDDIAFDGEGTMEVVYL